MSNKRNRRRIGQRVRSEASRKPKRITKAQEAFVASLPKERARRAKETSTKRVRQERAKWISSWRYGVGGNRYRVGVKVKRTRRRKPRTNYGATYYRHSLDN